MYLRLFFIAFSILILASCQPSKKEEIDTEVEKPVFLYGYNLNDFFVIKDTIFSGDTFGSILDKNHISVNEVHNIIEKVKDTFDFRNIKIGKPYTLLIAKDTTEKAQVFIYEPSIREYSIIDFKDSIAFAKTIYKDILTKRKSTTGIITSSMFETLESQGINPVLAINLSEVYAWTIDFYRIQKYDKFKVIYDEQYVDDTIPVGIGKIHAAYFEHWKEPYYAFGYQIDTLNGVWQFFDEKALDLKRMFLKSPIKFGRISSRYSMSRYVSIYGKRRPHLGTDFAAPVGTPIMSTANGTVIASAYRGGNGNFVKIKHNNTYTTQYLHMSKRAVKKGDRVKQGQVIGYIGMTGNTTGPHVCYRFWVNNKQVDALKQKQMKSDPMPEKLKPVYLEFIKPLQREIDSLPYLPIIEDNTSVQDSTHNI